MLMINLTGDTNVYGLASLILRNEKHVHFMMSCHKVGAELN